jgi:hypothetical protein
VLKSLASLDDSELERLAGWFSQHVNRWGQLPRDLTHSPGYAYATARTSSKVANRPQETTRGSSGPARNRALPPY